VSEEGHEKKHVRALRKLGVRGETFYDEKGLYTIQTGGRKLTRVEQAAVHLAADGGFFDPHAEEDRRLARRLVSGKDMEAAKRLARRLR
jgi:hypothetical protein